MAGLDQNTARDAAGIIKAFVDSFDKNESIKARWAAESLKNMAVGLEGISKLNVGRIAKTAEALKKIGFDPNGKNGLMYQLSSAFKGALSLKKGSQEFGKLLHDFSKGLSTFSALNISRIKGNTEALFASGLTTDLAAALKPIIDLGSNSASITAGTSALYSAANGLQSFSNINLKGLSANLEALATGNFKNLQVFFAGLEGVDLSSISRNVSEPLRDLTEGLKGVSEINPLGLIGVSLSMKLFGGFLTSFLRNLSKLDDIDLSRASESFGTPLKEIGDGLKVFSELNIGYALVNLGLLKLFPGAFKPLIKAVQDKSLEDAAFAFGRPLKEIGDGLKAFSEVSWGQILASVLLLPPTIWAIKKSVDMAAGMDLEKGAKAVGDPLKTLGDGLTAFGNYSMARVLVSVAFLPTIFKLLHKASAFAEPLAKKMDAFEKVGNGLSKIGDAVGRGVGSLFGGLGKMWKDVAKGALAMALISGSLLAFGASLLVFGEVDWKSVGLGSIALVGLTAAILGLGVLVGSGAGGALLAAGAIALAAFGVALLPVAFAANLLGDGLGKMKGAILEIIPQLVQLGDSAPGLYKAAGGIMAISAAMATFAYGSAAAGLGGLIGKIAGGGTSPIDQIRELAEMAPDLDRTATALERIAATQAQLNSQEFEGSLAQYDESKASARRAESKKGTEGDVNSLTAVSNRTSNTTVFNNSWVPDRTSLFVLNTAGAC